MTRVLMALYLLCSMASAGPVRVTLKGTARISPGTSVVLGDLARIDGDSDLARRVILKADDARLKPGRWVTIDAAEILQTLEIDPAQVMIRGSSCRVRQMQPAPAPVLTRTDRGKIVEVFKGPILRDQIRVRIAAELGVADQDLRLNFPAEAAQIIRTPTAGKTVEIQPLGLSGEMPIAVSVYDGDRIVLSQTMRIGVQIHRKALVATHLIARRAEINRTQFTTEMRWVSPTIKLADEHDMEHATARKSLKPGDLIELTHIEPPIVVRRGDMVTVRCLAGSIVAKVSARAMSDARDGDRIRFEPVNGSKRFYARVNGPGRAVLVTASHEEKAQ